jgi:phosphoesterase RecJ-like protein
MIVLDCGSPERAEVVPAWIEAGGKIINIDHHASNNNFGNINIVDENASSTSELICLLCKYSENFKITPSAADALYTGLITDTGRFTYENTTRVSLECAAELLNCGAVPSKLGDKLYRSVSKKCVRLSARAASSLQFRYSGKVAWVSLSRKDFAHFDATPADAGDIIDIARNISGVEIAFFFYEIPDTNETKISIRSSAPFDATEIATHYNGGGHKRAAGCSMEKPLDETIENVLDFIEEHWTLDN